ncbi:MAG TPA: hypothetical protein DEH25_01940, partial [Chloroflexi bacterium]|nr:hypothetical protein [Chloroflexota bacterium]
MSWKYFLKTLLRNVILIFVITMPLLGLIGYFTGGKAGFVQGVNWGFVLGLVIMPFMTFVLIYRYWAKSGAR